MPTSRSENKTALQENYTDVSVKEDILKSDGTYKQNQSNGMVQKQQFIAKEAADKTFKSLEKDIEEIENSIAKIIKEPPQQATIILAQNFEASAKSKVPFSIDLTNLSKNSGSQEPSKSKGNERQVDLVDQQDDQ